MLLKRLQLYGFKSFAERTEIEFQPGITAIVGPNGSGKSNLVDAILWVLGEQNIRNLRGEGSIDVIFAGTEQRRPLGLAEVSLTLENSLGLLPLPYLEVTITRRIYRSGESEYFINRNPCRLKDIYELFLDTGVGRDAYSIVGQAQIDAVLSARGEERRQLLEEAAGIKKYRWRRKEALQKLENTRSNLCRVQDLLAELEREANSLKVEAEKTREYRSWEAQLRKLELSLLLQEIQQREKEVAEGKQRIQALQQNLEQLRAQIALLQAEELQEEATLSQLSHRLNDQQNQLLQLRERKLQEEGERKTLHLHQLQIEREIAEIEKDLQKMETQLQFREEERVRKEEEASLLHQQITRIEEELSKLQPQRDSLKQHLKALEQRRDAHQLQQQSLEQEILVLTERLEGVKARQAYYQEQQENLQARENSLKAEIEKIEDQIKELEQRIQKASSLLEERSLQIHQVHQALEEKRRDLSAFQKEREAQQETLRTCQAQIQSLEQMIENLEGLQKGVRAVLRACQQGRLPGRYRLVANLISVEDQYHLAIETALGASAQNLVTDTDEEAQKAIQYLKKHRAGRATFLPLDLVKPERMTAPSLPGIVGVAVDLIDCPPEVLPAMTVLLGRTLVVKTLEDAVRWIRQGIKAHRWVTLEGEVISAGGAMTGGSREPLEGLISRRMTLIKLREQEKSIKDLEAFLKEKIETLSQEIRELLRKQKGLEEEQQRLQLASSQEKTLLTHLRQEVPKLQQSLESCQRELCQISKAQRSSTEEVSLLKDRITLLQAQLQAVRQQTSHLENEGEDYQDRLRQVEEEISRRKIFLIRWQEQRDSCQQIAQRIREEKQDLLAQWEEKKNLLAQRKSLLEEVRGQMGKLDSQIQALSEELKEAERQKALLEAHYQKQLDRLGSLRNTLHAKNRDSQALLEKLHRAEIRVASQKGELEQLQARLKEQFTEEEIALKSSSPCLSRPKILSEITSIKQKLKDMEPVHPSAPEEYQRLTERIAFLREQERDLLSAEKALLRVVEQIDQVSKERFLKTFKEMQASFQKMFQKLFGGGYAQLHLPDPDNPLETGVEISVQPPGKKLQHLSLLSGGEKALTALAFLFGLLEIKPSPFCLLDEVDSALDEANIDRFTALLKEFAQKSQLIIITHNRATMAVADILHGLTMPEPGVSKVLSLRMEEVTQPQGQRFDSSPIMG